MCPSGRSHHSIRDIQKDLLTYGTLMTLMTGYIVFMVINIRQYQCNDLITIHVIKKKNWIICPVLGVADITADILVVGQVSATTVCWLTVSRYFADRSLTYHWHLVDIMAETSVDYLLTCQSTNYWLTLTQYSNRYMYVNRQMMEMLADTWK